MRHVAQRAAAGHVDRAAIERMVGFRYPTFRAIARSERPLHERGALPASAFVGRLELSVLAQASGLSHHVLERARAFMSWAS